MRVDRGVEVTCKQDNRAVYISKRRYFRNDDLMVYINEPSDQNETFYIVAKRTVKKVLLDPMDFKKRKLTAG